MSVWPPYDVPFSLTVAYSTACLPSVTIFPDIVPLPPVCACSVSDIRTLIKISVNLKPFAFTLIYIFVNK